MNHEEVQQLIRINNKKINDIIGKETGGVHFGGDRELFAAVASIEELYDLSYVGEAQKKQTEIINVLINAMLEDSSAREVCQLLKAKGLKDEDAWKVAQTELNRIKNIGSWYQYSKAGYKFFSVKHAEDACKKCTKTYNHKKFPIEQLELLPPLHHECRCILLFHRK